MSIQERFFVTHSSYSTYAPSTIGCPKWLHTIDHACFKKSKAEKELLLTLRSQLPKARNHKFQTYLKATF